MKRKFLLIPLCVFFLAITVYAGIELYNIGRDYKAGEDAYQALGSYVQPAPQKPKEEAKPQPVSPSEEPEATEPTQTESSFPQVDFEGLWEVCPDVVAWICMEDTVLSYPVVQARNNDYYLRRLVDGTSNSAGSLFMDYLNAPDFSDENTVIYGHNMKNGSMFATVVEYKDQAFYDAHPTCQIMTPQGNYTVEFFAGFVANLKSRAWDQNFDTEEDYAAWLAEAKKKSTFQSDVTPTAQDRVVTLSTCSYEYDDARYVLMGVLREEN